MKEACKTLSMTVPTTAVKMLRQLHDPAKETWSKFLTRLTLRGLVYEIARVALETTPPPPEATTQLVEIPKIVHEAIVSPDEPPEPPPSDDPIVNDIWDAITEPTPHHLLK